MKTRLLFLTLSFACSTLLWSVESRTLSEADTAVLKEKAQAIQQAMATGDADGIIRYTHPAIVKFFPSREQFETATRDAVKSMAGKITIEKTEWGVPSALYESGTEEVSFLPMTNIMKIGEKRGRAVGFLIAAREKGTNEWRFADGSGLRKDPSMLWKLFPALPKDIVTPPNTMEPLD